KREHGADLGAPCIPSYRLRIGRLVHRRSVERKAAQKRTTLPHLLAHGSSMECNLSVKGNPERAVSPAPISHHMAGRIARSRTAPRSPSTLPDSVAAPGLKIDLVQRKAADQPGLVAAFAVRNDVEADFVHVD